ncbi:hypothetical protein [Pseudoalteromonas ardens]|uniref:hypothetical protein n=1 Tax=Pseudoalteromonas ardens TaxID=3048490 RepID=UPI0024C448DE|nr:hypothetical protein [Pseudoalteromonas sp. R96]MDK1311007.1 hypothetical protein [Pseudoalteromonas sp. R96]
MFSFCKRPVSVKVNCSCEPQESLLLKASQVSQVVMLFVGVVTVLVASRQITSSQQQGQTQLAKEMYGQYLELAFESPYFAEPQSGLACPDNGSDKGQTGANSISVIDSKGKDDLCWAQYTWFVSRLLYASENILSLDLPEKHKTSWATTINLQISYHLEYISSESFAEVIPNYSCSLQSILRASNEFIPNFLPKECRS